MKILKYSLVAFVMFFLTACGTKLPFAPQKPLKDASLVYVYIPNKIVVDEDNTTPGKYTIRINNKRTKKSMTLGEYMPYNLKTGSITLSATKDALIEHGIKLNLKAGKIYYVKVNTQDNGDFNIKLVDEQTALKEIAKTGLADTYVVEENEIITQLIEPKKKEKTVTSTSKVDELRKAYQLKQDGIISEEEYKTLKREILTK